MIKPIISAAEEKELALVNEAQALLDKRKAKLNAVRNKARAIAKKQQLKLKAAFLSELNKQMLPFFNKGIQVSQLVEVLNNANLQPINTQPTTSEVS